VSLKRLTKAIFNRDIQVGLTRHRTCLKWHSGCNFHLCHKEFLLSDLSDRVNLESVQKQLLNPRIESQTIFIYENKNRLSFFSTEKLFLHLQTGKRGHSSVEDAKATMELYKVVENTWEQKLTALSLTAKAMDLALNQK